MSVHLAKTLDWREAECGHAMTSADKLPTKNHSYVTCPPCLAIVERRRAGQEPGWPAPIPEPSPRERLRRQWMVACVGGDTDLGFDDWSRGVGAPTPNRQIPPYMASNDDGLFVFYDKHIYGNALEVVPQTTGNVEITISLDNDGTLFTLSHLDRADLIRALLHDFHYSPETGGPTDD